MNPNEKPAEPVGLSGLSEVVLRGSRQWNLSAKPVQVQRPWEDARVYERQAQIQTRVALAMRGADRFQALALAATFAGAARAVAMGGAQ